MAIFIPLVTKFDPKGLQGAQRALANFQNFAVDVGRVAAAAIAAVAVSSVREATQFETTFAKIQGLVGLTAKEITELEAAARELGPQFGASGAEAGEALFFITSAGLRGASAVNVLEASLKGAAIGLGDAKTIADLATSAVNAYGESNLNGAKAVDVLAEAVRLGKLEPAELAQSMGQVLPLASNLGVRFDEVGAAMAGMSKTGTDASTAATQLRGIFTTLAKPTAEAERALAGMGLSAEGLRQQIREKGLFSALETLTDAFDGNIQATTEVFGNVRALSGVLDLMGASVDDNRELFKLMADDLGVLDEAFEITAETTQFKFDRAMATVKDSLLEIGLAILDNLQPHLDTFQTWMEDNGPAIEQGFIKIFDSINRIIESEIVKDLVQGFKDLWPEVEALAVEVEALAEELKPLTDLIGPSLNAVLVLLKETIGDLATSMKEYNTQVNLFNEDAPSTIQRIEEQGDGWRRFINPQLFVAIDRMKEYLRLVREAFAVPLPDAPHMNVPNITGRRAGGGPVASGSSYLVGEMGPEIFTPAAGGGRITPNGAMGGAVFNITVNAGMGAGDGARLGEQIVSAIRRYERSSGPVFASA